MWVEKVEEIERCTCENSDFGVGGWHRCTDSWCLLCIKPPRAALNQGYEKDI